MLDPNDVDDVTIAAWHDLSCELELEDIPEDRPAGVEKMLLDARHTSPERTNHRWLAMEGDRALAYAQATVKDTEDNRHLAFFWVGVRQEARRQGIGRRLAGLAADVAEAAGRTVLQSDTRQGSAGEAFLDSLGGRNAYLARCSRLYTKELDADLLRGWVDRAAERATEYSLVSWESPTPEEYLEGYAQVLHAMNTAPMQDLDWEDEVFTPELMRGWEAQELATGTGKWVIVARHEPSGEFAGLTELFFDDPARPERCFQGNTGVDPTHRDKGLGRWLKAANALRLLEERPEVEWIDTWNQDENRPMLNINEAMGFRPHRMYTEWQIPIEEMRKRFTR